MNHLVSIKSIAAAALVLGTLAATSVAHAHSDVQFSISLQSPGFYIEPAPVYVQPAPVYFQPAPVYVQPAPVYIRPAPVFVQPAPVYGQPVYGYGWSNGWDHGRGHGHGHNRHQRGWTGDRDGDGAPNRYDRFPNNPYYR